MAVLAKLSSFAWGTGVFASSADGSLPDGF